MISIRNDKEELYNYFQKMGIRVQKKFTTIFLVEVYTLIEKKIELELKGFSIYKSLLLGVDKDKIFEIFSKYFEIQSFEDISFNKEIYIKEDFFRINKDSLVNSMKYYMEDRAVFITNEDKKMFYLKLTIDNLIKKEKEIGFLLKFIHGAKEDSLLIKYFNKIYFVENLTIKAKDNLENKYLDRLVNNDIEISNEIKSDMYRFLFEIFVGSALLNLSSNYTEYEDKSFNEKINSNESKAFRAFFYKELSLEKELFSKLKREEEQRIEEKIGIEKEMYEDWRDISLNLLGNSGKFLSQKEINELLDI